MAMTAGGGVRLHYYRRGAAQRPQVVLVHGLAANTAFWFPQLLPALARDYAVIAYDLRGHGLSEMPESGYSDQDMVADLEALLRHQRADRVHLVGHSYGGAVALNFAYQHPERVASLTVADTRLGSFQSDQHLVEWLGAGASPMRLERVAVAVAGRPATTCTADAAGDTGITRADRSGPFARMGPSPISARTRDRWLALLRSTSASRDLLTSPGPGPAQLAEIVAPVLTIYGERSDFVPSLRGLQQYLPDCQAVIVPGVGHFHPRSRPDFFLRELRGFLDRMDDRREAGR